MNENLKLSDIRRNIDAIDRQIVALLAQRARYVGQAAKVKHQKSQVVDRERIEDIIVKVRRLAVAQQMPPDLIEDIYRSLIDIFIAHEEQEWEKLNGL